MVATDTVVGIVGAVVLVAVMAGVFVYEYNNTESTEVSVTERQAHFEEDYAGLVATQDIDGDGKPNFNDTDLDDDGVPNANDTMITQTVAVNENVDAPGPTGSTPSTVPFTVSNGTERFQGTLTYTRTGGAVPNVQATVTGPGGFSATARAEPMSGNTQTLAFDVGEPLVPGMYTLTLTQEPAGGVLPVGQPAQVAGTLEVHYATPSAEETHGH